MTHVDPNFSGPHPQLAAAPRTLPVSSWPVARMSGPGALHRVVERCRVAHRDRRLLLTVGSSVERSSGASSVKPEATGIRIFRTWGAGRTNLLVVVVALAALVSTPALASCLGVAGPAADWLETLGANADGSWGDDPDIRPVVTAEVVAALRAHGRKGWAYYQGVTWLENHEMSNVDYRARRVAALLPHGDDVSADIAFLTDALSMSAANPGWGLSSDYEASPVDSGLAAQAIGLVDPGTPGLLEAVTALNALESGGWPQVAGGASDLRATAIILRAFASLQSSFPAQTTGGVSAAALLASANYSAASNVTRALAALALLRWSPGTPAADGLLALMESTQGVDGSWAQDAYATALALHACSAKLGTDDPTLQAAIYVPDFGLRRAINQALGKTMAAGVVSRADMQSLSVLDLSTAGVVDLTGLEEAVNLASLTLSINTQPDESPISGIAGLSVTRPTQSFGKPSAFIASDGTDQDHVELSWTVEPGATYNVYRATGGNGAEQIVTRVEAGSYFDTSAVPGELYFYQVSAVADGAPPVEGVWSDADRGYRALSTPSPVVTEILDATGDGATPLSGVRDLAVGRDGTVFVAADSGVFSVDRDGAVSDLVGSASGTLNTLSGPAGIAVDDLGFVYVTSRLSNEVYEIDPATGFASVLIDTGGDGSSLLLQPTDVAVGTAGDVFVVGSVSNNAFRITPAGAVSEIIDASGADGTPLLNPRGVAVQGESTAYVAGFGAGSWAVFRVTPSGSSKILDSSGDGTGQSPLESPLSVAVDPDSGRVVVGGYDSDNVYEFRSSSSISRLLDSGLTGSGLVDVSAVAVDVRGSTIAAGEGSDTVYRVTRTGVFEVLLDATGDGSSGLSQPTALAVDAAGNVFVGDGDSVFRVSTGAVQVADTTGDGTFALDCAGSVAVSGEGAVFAAGQASDNVFRIDPVGLVEEVVSPLGDGSNSLYSPAAMVLADDGSLYVAGAASHNVLRLTPWGQVTELVGSTAALLEPSDLYADGGEIWVTGRGSHTVVRMTTDGQAAVVATASGDGFNPLTAPSALVGKDGELFVAGEDSDNVFWMTSDGSQIQEVVDTNGGGVAALDRPLDLALGFGGLYIAGEQSNNVLRYGIGTGAIDVVLDVSGDGTTPLSGPRALAFDGAGNLYVTDGAENVFRLNGEREVDRVFDSSGDGLNLASGPIAVAGYPACDDIAVTGCGSDNVYTSIRVPEPATLLALPVLLAGLAGLFQLRIRLGARRRRRRGGTIMRVLPPLLLCSLLLSNDPSSAEGSRSAASMNGDELEVTRTVSGHLFAVQREERALLDTPAMRDLREQLKGLHEALTPDPLATGRGSIRLPGSTSPQVASSPVLDAQRQAARDRQRDARSRVRAAADAVEAEASSGSASRWFGVRDRSVEKAKALVREAAALDGIDAASRRLELNVLRRRTTQVPLLETQDSPPDLDPMIESITTHRRVWTSQP